MSKTLRIENKSLSVDGSDWGVEVYPKDKHNEICFEFDAEGRYVDLYINVSQAKDLIDFLIEQTK